jgi:hypothetical protein
VETGQACPVRDAPRMRTQGLQPSLRITQCFVLIFDCKGKTTDIDSAIISKPRRKKRHLEQTAKTTTPVSQSMEATPQCRWGLGQTRQLDCWVDWKHVSQRNSVLTTSRAYQPAVVHKCAKAPFGSELPKCFADLDASFSCVLDQLIGRPLSGSGLEPFELVFAVGSYDLCFDNVLSAAGTLFHLVLAYIPRGQRAKTPSRQ